MRPSYHNQTAIAAEVRRELLPSHVAALETTLLKTCLAFVPVLQEHHSLRHATQFIASFRSKGRLEVHSTRPHALALQLHPDHLPVARSAAGSGQNWMTASVISIRSAAYVIDWCGVRKGDWLSRPPCACA